MHRFLPSLTLNYHELQHPSMHNLFHPLPLKHHQLQHLSIHRHLLLLILYHYNLLHHLLLHHSVHILAASHHGNVLHLLPSLVLKYYKLLYLSVHHLLTPLPRQ